MTSAPSVPIAVTGAALLSPLGDSVDAVMTALYDGRCAIERTRSTEIGDFAEASIADFDAGRYAAIRGMRVYNRMTQLAICASKLALEDAKLATDNGAADDVGFVTASTYGHLDTLIEYDRSLVENGVARTNPALMPIGLPSAPGAATALAFHAKAFSITLANGSAGSLDAIALAARLLRSARARACVVVSAFSPYRELSVSAARAGLLASADHNRVFDANSAGRAFGEGAVAIVLERAEHAHERGAAAHGFVRGHAASFARRDQERAAALHRSSVAALRAADVTPAELALIASGADGSPAGDRAEAHALLDLLGDDPRRAVIAAIKGNLGDALDTSGLMQVVLGLAALRRGVAPPIVHLEEAAVPGLRYARAATALVGNTALVTATSHAGACSSLVVASVHDEL